MIKPWILVLALFAAAACNVSVVGVEGSGVSASEDRQVAAFEAVALSGSFAVEVGPARGVRVEADDNIVPIVLTEVVGDVLKTSSQENFSTRTPIKVRVTTPRLVAVEHSGSGSIEAAADLATTRATVSLSGSGSVQHAGGARDVVSNIRGSGSVTPI